MAYHGSSLLTRSIDFLSMSLTIGKVCVTTGARKHQSPRSPEACREGGKGIILRKASYRKYSSQRWMYSFTASILPYFGRGS